MSHPEQNAIPDARGERKDRISPEELGKQFNELDAVDFIGVLRGIAREHPLTHFSIIADWVDVRKTRSAKAIFDQYATRLRLDSFTIRATRDQYKEDVNAFQSGVKWEEI